MINYGRKWRTRYNMKSAYYMILYPTPVSHTSHVPSVAEAFEWE